MIAIIDSGVGNVQSIANALAFLKVPHKITTDPNVLEKAEKLIFPGQGTFCDGMKAIKSGKLLDTLAEQVLNQHKLYLGICLGLQLLANTGLEDEEYVGLGWIPGIVRKVNTSEKLPHIGWNNVSPKTTNGLFSGLSDNPTFYFAHSYIIDPKDALVTTATCEYGERFVASIQYKNIYGVQFHPEKSQKNGLQLLRNFVNIKT